MSRECHRSNQYRTVKNGIQVHNVTDIEKQSDDFSVKLINQICDAVYMMHSIKLLQKGICDLQTIQILQYKCLDVRH